METTHTAMEQFKNELVGMKGFKRHNPMSDRFQVHKFHHVEFWCGDATNTSKRYVMRWCLVEFARVICSFHLRLHPTHTPLTAFHLLTVIDKTLAVVADLGTVSA